MRNYIERLGISEGHSKNLASAYEGYATSIEDDKEKLPVAASSYLVAAVFRAVYGNDGACKLFSKAAKAYREAGHPFYYVAAVCAHEIESIYLDDSVLVDRLLSPNELFCFLIYQAGGLVGQKYDYKVKVLSHIYKMSTGMQSYEVGRVGLSLREYINAVMELIELRSQDIELRAWRRLFERAWDKTELSMTDKYHWHQMYGATIPLEPEIIAVSTILAAHWISLGRTSDELIGQLDLEYNALVPLEVAFDLFGQQPAYA